MTGTLSAAHLRRYGTLTVEEVSVLLRRGWEHSRLAAKHGVESIVQNYVADEPRPRRRYDFILHEASTPSFEDTMQLLKDMRANQDYWLNQ